MSGMRIYEFAKKHGVTSKEVLTLAKEQGMDFGSHMSSLNKEEASQLEKQLKGSKDSNKKEQKAPKRKKNNKPAQEAKKDNENTKKKQGKKKRQPTQQKEENETRGGRRRRNRRGGRRGNQQNRSKAAPTPRKHRDLPEKVVYEEGMNIQDLSKIIHRDTSEIIMKAMGLGIMANMNQSLSGDVIELILMEYGIEPEQKVVIDKSDLEHYFEDDSNMTQVRPPVVTIMGHVDHGKTTLLDSLRNANVAEGEAGGITQHIGAYQVIANDKPITFLDTPGHEAFTTMRARGADVTDVTIIVVAADDGVMPQTVEAINHAKAAEVPIIVAVNKIDKPTANPDRVMNELTEHGIIPEEWGGDTIFVPISALQRLNIDDLLETVLLVAEMEELKADPERRAIGSVIEAYLDRAQGATATLLVQQGTLRVGDPIVVGNTYGRVRTMTNDQGQRIREAGPSTPVAITGLQDTPLAGDLFVVFEDEKEARQAGETRAARAQQQQRENKNKITLDNLFESLQEGELKNVNVIIKGDVQGSVEALAASLQKIDVEGVKVNIIHQAVGGINESDISLANASNAIVIGFNVRPTPQARQEAEAEQIDIRLHRVIYDVIDEIETAMKGMLDPEYVEEITGQAVVRETFKVSKVGTIAGAFMLDGYIRRNSGVRVIRDNIVVYEGELSSLKRFQDDAREVTKGFEFGMMIENYNDIKVDDHIEAFHMVEVKPK
ncbi:translation initiation factor IF-2 [Dolosicoccus paucivorans]|uniref:Translation initiation factor IF-2 n=1 Tax=Dolosicoccus paucivorans TaxID=84521 RepID=A0A1G8PGY4_9LACT|nr:translation initiation factor IF-2 [Dolosicoccus paucivorans]PMC59116.1 translation initiation factor IF-2 [Dolosicoccus paucivorans]SDI91545.1 translation initiation factor IF-2 [Dolosicoccus paucivorans]